MQDTGNPFWGLIVNEVFDARENSAGYIVTIDEFFSDVSGKPKMSDLLKYATNLQNNLELRPPKKMIRSAKTAVRAINLYSNSVPIIHASDIVTVAVELDDMMESYRGLVAPNLNVAEKSYHGTKFAASICGAFLATDKLTVGIQSADSETEATEIPEIKHARKAAATNLRKIETVHIGIRDKLREAFRQKVQ